MHQLIVLTGSRLNHILDLLTVHNMVKPYEPSGPLQPELIGTATVSTVRSFDAIVRRFVKYARVSLSFRFSFYFYFYFIFASY